MEQKEQACVCAVCGEQANWILHHSVRLNNYNIVLKESLLCRGSGDCCERLGLYDGQSWFLTQIKHI